MKDELDFFIFHPSSFIPHPSSFGENLISIREFTLADYDTVYTLWQNAGDGLGIGRSDTREEIAKKLQRDPDLFLVAEDETSEVLGDFGSLGRKIIGTVIGGYDGRRGMIYHLAVDRAYRARGIGKLLMDEVERRLQAKGCLKAYLLVKRGNEEVVKFYRHLGWETMEITIMGKTMPSAH
jgi:ribosomal protein S18 acetylase RimI-like enzyme